MTIVCEHSTDLGAEPEAVFALLDDFERLPQWHAHCEGLAKIGPGPNMAGDRLRYAHCEGGKHHLMDGVILSHDAPYRLTCRYLDKSMQVIVDFRLVGTETGTHLTHRIEITPHTLIARMTSALIGAKADAQARQALDNLARLLSRQMAA